MPRTYPSELPERPIGWTRTLKLHMNFGRKGGAASYRILDAEGRETPIEFQYDTRKGGGQGFTLPGVDKAMTWAELRARWPAWVREQQGDGA